MKEVLALGDGFISKLQDVGLIKKNNKEILKIENFFEYVMDKNKAALARKEIVESTYTKRENTKNLFLGFLQEKEIAVSDIRKLTVEDCKNYRDLRLGKCANETVQSEIKQLRQMFDVAIDMELVTKNPFKKVKVKTDKTDLDRDWETPV